MRAAVAGADLRALCMLPTCASQAQLSVACEQGARVRTPQADCTSVGEQMVLVCVSVCVSVCGGRVCERGEGGAVV